MENIVWQFTTPTTNKMKAVVLCLVVLFAVVYGEMCQHNDDCKLTTCSSGTQMCMFHVCTCGTATTGECSMKDDCMKVCRDHREHHCVDGRCLCRH